MSVSVPVGQGGMVNANYQNSQPGSSNTFQLQPNVALGTDSRMITPGNVLTNMSQPKTILRGDLVQRFTHIQPAGNSNQPYSDQHLVSKLKKT